MTQEYIVDIIRSEDMDAGGFGLCVSHCNFKYEWIDAITIKFTGDGECFKEKLCGWLDEKARLYKFSWCLQTIDDL